jgi:hypothetical protein
MRCYASTDHVTIADEEPGCLRRYLNAERHALTTSTVRPFLKPGFVSGKFGRTENTQCRSANRKENYAAGVYANAMMQVINQNASRLASNTQPIARQT